VAQTVHRVCDGEGTSACDGVDDDLREEFRTAFDRSSLVERNDVRQGLLPALLSLQLNGEPIEVAANANHYPLEGFRIARE
jgi:hypothetical protein